jgi:hypothetical protein
VQQHNNNVTFSTIQLYSTIFSVVINLLFGITLGLFSSLLSRKFGARYRCPQDCDISFSRIDTLNHLQFVHGNKPMNRTKDSACYYNQGFKRCVECEIFIEWGGMRCPCCDRIL